MHDSHDVSGVDDRVLLGCLNTWPPGTVGHVEEIKMIMTLNELCKKFGYGAVPHMAKMIEEVWRAPTKVREIRLANEERHQLILDGRNL